MYIDLRQFPPKDCEAHIHSQWTYMQTVMWGCFCGKKKARTASLQSGQYGKLTAQSSALDVKSLTEEDSSKLAELRCQFVQAQSRQRQPEGRSRRDQVVGFVDVPLYRSEGRQLRDAGQSYQVFFYDK